MPEHFSDQQLQAYLDESLATVSMSAIEQRLRTDDRLRQRLVALAEQREAGVHGLGEIWRRNRCSCPSRAELGSYLLDALDDELKSYIRFHLEQIGCRVCVANLQDLQDQRADQAESTQTRRRRYFETSAGYLERKKD